MKITEVRIKLAENNRERVLAFCSVAFDNSLVVHDIKVIEGDRGLFISMPSRKLMDHCQCGRRNHLQARYCNQCGTKLDENRARLDANGRAKLHADIAHPINQTWRQIIHDKVLKAYHKEKERSKQPGYMPRYNDSLI